MEKLGEILNRVGLDKIREAPPTGDCLQPLSSVNLGIEQTEREAPEDILIGRVRLGGVPANTRLTHRFSTWKPTRGLQEAVRYCKRYAQGKFDHHFLTLKGIPGVGKTHLSLAIVWEWLEASFGPLAYCQVETMLDSLRDGYAKHRASLAAQQRGDEASGIIDPHIQVNFLCKCGLLVLDDLGAEKGSEWAEAKLDEIVDYRYIHGKPMVVTTNLRLDQLPARIADRLREGRVLILEAPSYRSKR